MYLITIDVPATGAFFNYSRRVSEVGPTLGFHSLISHLSCCGWPGVLQTPCSPNASGPAAWKKDGAYGTLVSRLHVTDVTRHLNALIEPSVPQAIDTSHSAPELSSSVPFRPSWRPIFDSRSSQ
jgi:hypothetical protein